MIARPVRLPQLPADAGPTTVGEVAEHVATMLATRAAEVVATGCRAALVAAPGAVAVAPIVDGAALLPGDEWRELRPVPLDRTGRPSRFVLRGAVADLLTNEKRPAAEVRQPRRRGARVPRVLSVPRRCE